MGLQINVCCGWGIKSEAQLETLQGDGDAMAAVQAVLRYMYFGQNKIRKETCFIHIIKRLGTRIIRTARAAADPVMGSRPLSSEGRRAQSSSSSAQVSLLGHGQRPEQPQGMRREQRQVAPMRKDSPSASVSTSSSGPLQQRSDEKRPKKKKKTRRQRAFEARQRKRQGGESPA